MKSIVIVLCIGLCSYTVLAQSPFTCTSNDGFGYYVSSSSSSSSGNKLTYASSRLSQIVTSTGARTTLCSAAQIGVSLNALAFNPHDNFLYAVSRYDATQFSGKMYRIGENCQLATIPVSGGIVSFSSNNRNAIDSAGGNISSGTFDLDNNYYVNTSFTNTASVGFTNKLQKIKLTGSSATVVSTVTLTCSSGCTNKLQINDIVYDESTGKLYGSNSQTKKLYSINATTGVITPIGSTGTTGTVLGIYKNRFGAVRAIDDAGKIYSVNLSTGAFTSIITVSDFASDNADAASGCYKPPSISGRLFIDANGLSDNTVNGTGTDRAGTTILYANLVQNNLIVKSSSIGAAGNFQFLGNFLGAYEVQISATLGVIGVAPPAQGLPTTHQFVGDFVGVGAGSDGDPNGKININVISGGGDVVNVNFGIDTKPIAKDVMAPPQTNPGGTIKVNVSPLLVSDAEDGIPTVITIGQVPNHNTKGILYYNDQVVTNNQTIANFQASLLKFDPKDGAVSVSFNYTTRDAANVVSNIATVTMEFTAILPITLTSFEGIYIDKCVKLNWATASELNSDYFMIQRSVTGDDFEDLAKVNAIGFSASLQQYSFTDQVPGSNHYYRLKDVDFDGSSDYSKVIFVSHGSSSLEVFPTLIDNMIYISFDNKETAFQIEFFSIGGGKILMTNLQKGNRQVDLTALPSGLYFAVIRNMQDGTTVSKKLYKK